MIAKNRIFKFFDMLKIAKYIIQNNSYRIGRQVDRYPYDFQSIIQKNKD